MLEKNNKMYKVEWDFEALKSLEEIAEKFGEETEISIKERVENHLASHPYQNGIPMKGKLEGLWRYRCLDKFRVIYEILEDKIVIEILDAGHREENFYEKFKEFWNKK